MFAPNRIAAAANMTQTYAPVAKVTTTANDVSGLLDFGILGEDSVKAAVVEVGSGVCFGHDQLLMKSIILGLRLQQIAHDDDIADAFGCHGSRDWTQLDASFFRESIDDFQVAIL